MSAALRLERVVRAMLVSCMLSAVFLARAGAQTFSSSNYTVEHGLPNNNLHCLLQDNRGFIWIGTENGLVRFDGTSFRQYRTAEGLPDNEIISLRSDGAGRIWALAYRGAPSVYDPGKDRFDRKGILSISGDRTLAALDDGSIALNTPGSVFIYKRGLREQLGPLSQSRSISAPHITVPLGNEQYLLIGPDSFRLYEQGQIKAAYASLLPAGARAVYVHGALYYCDSNGICKTGLDGSGAVRQMCIARQTLNASRLSFTGRHLALISDNGTAASLIDTGNLGEVARLPLNGVLARDIMEDAEGNVWIASIGQGLIKLSQHRVTNYNAFLPPGMSPGTVAIDGSTLLCGDDKGRIAVFRNGCLERLINISRWSRAVSRIRSIVVLRDGYYIAVEGDASLLLDKQYNIVSVFNRPQLNYSDRCAVLWRDTIILAGSHTGAVRLDYKNCHSYDTIAIRTTAIAADGAGRLIIGSSDGLYRKDDTGLHYFGGRHSELASRVTDICVTPDGLIWVALAANYLVALRGDDIAGIIPFGKGVQGNVCNSLCPGSSGQLWAGTDISLIRLEYSFNGSRLPWKATSFGAADGIGGQVADIALQHDTVYAATSTGIYSFTARMEPRLTDVPIYITGIRINDRDTILRESWDLPYSYRDWNIHFAGISYSGYRPLFQYRINNDAWQDVAEDHLPLKRLAPGTYNIQIRALRRDGTPSSLIAAMHIHLRAPFWMSVWFWLLAFIVLVSIVVWLLQYVFRRKREKQLRQIGMEHELITSQQQTFSALMNPHFIFNALNSIQHYVLAQDKRAANKYLSGFGRLIRMNFESAQKAYISLDEELERLQLYLSLEQMRYGNRLSYMINVADDVAPEDWRIPAMIIQPYVENALLHGIAPASNEGRLDITIARRGANLHITICDNGIGIEASKRLKGEQAHASHSMELIRKRIAILRKLHGEDIQIETGPCYPADAQHPGTKVQMIFPGRLSD